MPQEAECIWDERTAYTDNTASQLVRLHLLIHLGLRLMRGGLRIGCTTSEASVAGLVGRGSREDASRCDL